MLRQKHGENVSRSRGRSWTPTRSLKPSRRARAGAVGPVFFRGGLQFSRNLLECWETGGSGSDGPQRRAMIHGRRRAPQGASRTAFRRTGGREALAAVRRERQVICVRHRASACGGASIYGNARAYVTVPRAGKRHSATVRLPPRRGGHGGGAAPHGKRGRGRSWM
jgi:hypothetical protein